MKNYPVLKAYHDYGPGLEPRAIVVHMAEGGHTAAFLARPDVDGEPDRHRGVSVHFVVERSGRVVQTLSVRHISGGLNPRLLRPYPGHKGYGAIDDLPFTNKWGLRVRYGSTAARIVLGEAYRNPNSYTIQIEVEGFALAGPSLVQHLSLVDLVKDLRRSLPTLRGVLGHRDFQSYKRCPGRLINWGALGGHGRWSGATG